MILFIVNPISGGRNKNLLIAAIKHGMDGYDFDIVRTEYAGHAAILARETSAETVVAVGGDGTVSEVARALVGTGKTLGIIPCGSGDGLARHLHISHILFHSLRTIKNGAVTTIDHGLINGKPFFCTCGVGLDAIVSDKFAKASRRGLPTYIEKALQTWIHFKPENYHLEIDGKAYELKAVLITVGNANQWGNEGRIAPMASLCDGLLDVTVIKPFRNVDIPLLAAQLMDGRLNHNGHVLCLRGRDVKIVRDSEGPAHFDGDPMMLGREIGVSIVPAALKVLVPVKYKSRV